MREPAGLEIIDERLRLSNARWICLNDNDGRIHSGQGNLRLFKEIDEAGAIDDGQIYIVAFAMCKCNGGGLQVGNVFGFVIGDGRTVCYGAASWNRATVREHSLHESGLARVMRADESDIAKASDVRHSTLQIC